MKNKSHLFSMVILIFTIITASCKSTNEPSKIQLLLAEKYFTDLKEILSQDNGKLWEENLYGPIMLVIQESRTIIANQQTKDNSLIKKCNIYCGTLPNEISLANTARNYKDEMWTFVQWNNNFSDRTERNILLIHECWHRIQGKIGISSCMSTNQHLDDVEGALLMKLEFYALISAMQNNDVEKIKKDLYNTLTIRKMRQSLALQNNENQFESHEGLAEYTALKLMSTDTEMKTVMRNRIIKKLKDGLNKDGYSNSFAYITGPAYGFILDELQPTWREQILNGKTINDVITELIDIQDNLILDKEIEQIITFYNAGDFLQQESFRLTNLKNSDIAMIEKFTKGEILIIPNDNINFSYNPMEKLIPVDSLGVIYKTMHLSGNFGIIEAQNGVMITSNWSHFILPYDEYKIKLKESYKTIKIDDKKYIISNNF